MTARTLTALVLAAAVSGPALAGAHQWRFNELYTNADGTIQFIEMHECCGANNEVFLVRRDITSTANVVTWGFGANLPCTNCTANQFMLLGTQAYADLPGVPAPDFIIPSGLFGLDGDTLLYWQYINATWTYGPGLVPTDGIHSLNRDETTGVNSPTNLAGETGTITFEPCHPGDLDASGSVGFADLNRLLARWGACPGCPEDIDGSGSVGFTDLNMLLTGWGSCS